MVTIGRIGGSNIDNGTEFFGLSTDTKPIKDVVNGSTFYEMDTKKMYMFDEENSQWLAQS